METWNDWHRWMQMIMKVVWPNLFALHNHGCLVDGDMPWRKKETSKHIMLCQILGQRIGDDLLHNSCCRWQSAQDSLRVCHGLYETTIHGCLAVAAGAVCAGKHCRFVWVQALRLPATCIGGNFLTNKGCHSNRLCVQTLIHSCLAVAAGAVRAGKHCRLVWVQALCLSTTSGCRSLGTCGTLSCNSGLGCKMH